MVNRRLRLTNRIVPHKTLNNLLKPQFHKERRLKKGFLCEAMPFRLHRSRGHFPYDVNCESCCSSKGKVPARRLKRQLQKVDFYYFGKLRVLLLVHVASRYSMSIPAMELHDPNLLFNVDRFVREIGLHQKTLTFRCDNEQGLISMCERVASQRRENQ